MNAEEQRVDYAVVENVGWVRPEAVTHQQRAILRPLGEVVKPTRPRVKPSDKPNLPFIGMEHIEAHTMRLLGTVPASTMKSSAVHFQPDDVLYGRLRPYLNKVYRPDFEGLCSAEFIVFPKTGGIDSRYLQHFLNSSAFVSYASHLNAGDRPRVDFEQLAQYPFPVAPLDQQKRIVAEIEKQFSRLDEAVANLKRVKANLKRYKAAVLKAAVEGRLTEAWRKQHPDTEPASKFLKRILAERRTKWEQAELTKMQAKGKTPKDDAWKKKYPEPIAPDATNLPELPEGWVWATFEQLTSDLMNGYGKRSQVEGQPQIVLRLADISDGEISYADVRRINCTVDETRKYVLAANDLLILRVNGSPELVGRFVLVRSTNEDALFCDHFIRVRCANSNLSVWLRLYADSERFRRYIDLNKVSSAGQNTINQGALLPFAVPLPPAMEQQNIVAGIDRRLSLADEAEAQVNANLQRAIVLRGSVLARAFRTDKYKE